MEGKTNFSKRLKHSLMDELPDPDPLILRQIYATESTHNQSIKISVEDAEKPPAIEEQTNRPCLSAFLKVKRYDEHKVKRLVEEPGKSRFVKSRKRVSGFSGPPCVLATCGLCALGRFVAGH